METSRFCLVGGVLATLIGLSSCGTYDVNEAVQRVHYYKTVSADNVTSSQSRRPSRSDGRFLSNNRRKDSLGSASGYGGGGGYEYDCNSALGLFGLLGLLSALRDIINQLTQATTGRRKRSVQESRVSLLSEMMGGFGEDVVDVMSKDLPLVIIPLVAQFAEMSDFDHPSECALRSVCLANRHIVGTYGGVGRALASMITSTVVSQFSSAQSSTVGEAAKNGRKMEDCASFYSKCEEGPKADLSSFFEIEQDINDINDLVL